MKYERNWGQLGMRYKTYTMEDALEAIIDYRGKTPKKSEKGIPTLSAKSVKNNHIDYDSCYYISSDEYKRFMVRGLPQIGDVLLTTEAPLGMVAQLDRNDVGIAQRLLTLRGKQGILDNEYLLYYLQSPIGQALLRARETGTTVTGIKQSEFRKIQIYIPDIENQRKIGGILRGLDDKIAVNNSINKNLEQQAQAIFKSWFVDFEPFNGEMPYDWTVYRLGDIASIKTNSFSPVKNPDAQLEHYSIPAYDEQKYPVFESAAGVKSNKYILSKNSVMISKLNPDTKRVWRPMCLSEPAVSSTEFIIFEAFNPAYRDFVFSIIDSAAFSDWMCAHTTGSTNSRQRTTPSATLEFQIALPDEKTITDFCAIVTPMYDDIAANVCENQRLAQLRDSILPKLMSGELDVSNIDL